MKFGSAATANLIAMGALILSAFALYVTYSSSAPRTAISSEGVTFTPECRRNRFGSIGTVNITYLFRISNWGGRATSLTDLKAKLSARISESARSDSHSAFGYRIDEVLPTDGEPGIDSAAQARFAYRSLSEDSLGSLAPPGKVNRKLEPGETALYRVALAVPAGSMFGQARLQMHGTFADGTVRQAQTAAALEMPGRAWCML
ncbi:MAG TPA: hypothetical protein VF782_03815 [Allosphingosinicella sp.]